MVKAFTVGKLQERLNELRQTYGENMWVVMFDGAAVTDVSFDPDLAAVRLTDVDQDGDVIKVGKIILPASEE